MTTLPGDNIPSDVIAVLAAFAPVDMPHCLLDVPLPKGLLDRGRWYFHVTRSLDCLLACSTSRKAANAANSD